MEKFNNFPDLAKYFELHKIQMDLESLNPPMAGLVTTSIISTVKAGGLKQVIEMVKCQAKTNRSQIEDVIGYDLVSRILSL